MIYIKHLSTHCAKPLFPLLNKQSDEITRHRWMLKAGTSSFPDNFQAVDCITSLAMAHGKHSVLYSSMSAFTWCTGLVMWGLLCSMFGGVPGLGLSCSLFAGTEFNGIRDWRRVSGLPVFLINIYRIGKSQLDTASNFWDALSLAAFKNRNQNSSLLCCTWAVGGGGESGGLSFIKYWWH